MSKYTQTKYTWTEYQTEHAWTNIPDNIYIYIYIYIYIRRNITLNNLVTNKVDGHIR